MIQCEVAVIGGGLAGLAAADYLNRHQVDVKLFERQGIAGGRVFTRHLPSGQHFEEGAFSFTDAEKTLIGFVNRFSLEMIQHNQPDKLYLFEKQLKSFSKTKHLPDRNEDGITFQEQSIKEHSKERDTSFAASLQACGASQSTINWIRANTLSGLLGDSFENLSTSAASAYLAQYAGSTKTYSLKGGNDRLPIALANALGDRIHYTTPITKVVHSEGHYLLNNQVQAKRVILALPLVALQQIEFSPPLPEAKQKALAAVPYTSCSRLTFVGKMLDAIHGGVFGISDHPSGWYRDQTAFQTNPALSTVINVSTVGPRARAMASSQKRENIALAGLKVFRPEARTGNLESHFFTWDEVPWIKGGYSYFTPGTFSLQKELAARVGELYFAGEHTSEKFASMNGALESGLRAAEEVLASKV